MLQPVVGDLLGERDWRLGLFRILRADSRKEPVEFFLEEKVRRADQWQVARRFFLGQRLVPVEYFEDPALVERRVFAVA